MAYTKQTWLDRVGTFLNRFTKSNETLSSVELVNNPGTITQAGTAFSASRMNYMESGIENAHRIATPLSDLSRVMRINGDGVPTFPDNVAGITYFKDPGDWVLADFSYDASVTPSITGGKYRVAKATSAGNIQVYKTIDWSTKLVRVKVSASYTGTVRLGATIASVFTSLKEVAILAGQTIYVDCYIPASCTVFFVALLGTIPVGQYIEVDTLYTGSGLYDTPVYDKACCNRATNNGVLPVPGFRGQALRFTEASGLVFDNPVVGLVGTLYGRIRRETLTGATQIVCSNYAASPVNGISLMFATTNNLQLNIYSAGSAVQSVVIKTGLTDLLDHTFEIIATGTTLTPVFDGVRGTTVSGVLMMGSGVFTVGRNSASGGDHFLGLVHDIGFKSNVFTIDEDIRYHNGDDAFDSQQKSVTPVSYSIATRDATGKMQASAGTTALDVVNFGQVKTVITGSVTKTVGSGGDFASLNAAKAWLATVTPGDGATLELRLLSGFVMAEQWLQEGGDYGWVSITSVAAEVTITRSALTTAFNSFYPAFGCYAGFLPRIQTLFNMDSTGTSSMRIGIYLYGTSRCIVTTNKGIKGWCDVNVHACDASLLEATGANFSGSLGTSILAYSGAVCNLASANVSGGQKGIDCRDGATVNATTATATGCVSYGISAMTGGRITAHGINARKGVSDSTSDIFVSWGGIISANASIGGVSQTANTITANGIIFK